MMDSSEAITPAVAAMQAVLSHSDNVAADTTIEPSSSISSNSAEIDPQSIQMQIEALLSAAPPSSVAPVAPSDVSARLSLLLARSLSDLLEIHRRRAQQSRELAESYQKARDALDASFRANHTTMDRDWGWNRNQMTREVERKAQEIISASNVSAASSGGHDRKSKKHESQQVALQIVALLERLDQTQMLQQSNASESPNPLQQFSQANAAVDPSIRVGAPATTAVTTSTIAFMTSSSGSSIKPCVSGSDATTQTDAFLPAGASAAEDFDPMASPPTLRAFSPELPVVVVSSRTVGEGSRVRSTNVLSWDSSSQSLDRGVDIPSSSISPPPATQDHDPLAELAGLSSSPIATVEMRAFAEEMIDGPVAASTAPDATSASAAAAWRSSGMVHDPLAALAEVSSSPIASVEMRAFAEEMQSSAANGSSRSRSNSVSSNSSDKQRDSPAATAVPPKRSLFGAMYDAVRTTSHRLPSPPLDASKLATKTSSSSHSAGPAPPMLGRSRRAASVSGMFQPQQQQQVQRQHNHLQQPEAVARNRAASDMASRARRASVPSSSSSAAAAAAVAAFSPNAVVEIHTRQAADFGVTYSAEEARAKGTSSWFHHDSKVMHDTPTPTHAQAQLQATRAADLANTAGRDRAASGIAQQPQSKWWLQRGVETPKMEQLGALHDTRTFEKERRIPG